jgi:hypothetical protein
MPRISVTLDSHGHQEMLKAKPELFSMSLFANVLIREALQARAEKKKSVGRARP